MEGGVVMSQPTWDKFIKADTHYNSETKEKVTLDEGETVWINKFYVVHVKELKEGALWLSIRRQDRKAIRDWRHLQRIKNELAGGEREAVEIFPPQSQLVDGANQYHLWVLPEGQTTPFTWREGRQITNDSGYAGAQQREFESEEQMNAV
jgi:hypothetical protein